MCKTYFNLQGQIVHFLLMFQIKVGALLRGTLKLLANCIG